MLVIVRATGSSYIRYLAQQNLAGLYSAAFAQVVVSPFRMELFGLCRGKSFFAVAPDFFHHISKGQRMGRLGDRAVGLSGDMPLERGLGFLSHVDELKAWAEAAEDKQLRSGGLEGL
jgi:hypothetical protein